MKQLGYITIGILLLMVCASGAFAQSPWFNPFPDDPGYGTFPGGWEGSWVNETLPGPWENVCGISQYDNALPAYSVGGYGGTWGIKGSAQGGAGGASGGRMNRPAGGTDAYVVWKIYLGWKGNPGNSQVGFVPVKYTATDYGIGYFGSVLDVTQSPDDQADYSVQMISFGSDGDGYEVAPRVAGPTLARGWWEFKMAAAGLNISSYYREPGTTAWTLIGTQTQEEGFAPNYVAVCLGSRAFADEIGFNTEVPEPGALVAFGSGLIGLMGFAIRRRR